MPATQAVMCRLRCHAMMLVRRLCRNGAAGVTAVPGCLRSCRNRFILQKGQVQQYETASNLAICDIVSALQRYPACRRQPLRLLRLGGYHTF